VCIFWGQGGEWEGGWVQVSNYNVCMTGRCWGGRSAPCAIEGWLGDCAIYSLDNQVKDYKMGGACVCHGKV
jgi:hypothetical protein